jgi:hypothetical protein
MMADVFHYDRGEQPESVMRFITTRWTADEPVHLRE